MFSMLVTFQLAATASMALHRKPLREPFLLRRMSDRGEHEHEVSELTSVESRSITLPGRCRKPMDLSLWYGVDHKLDERANGKGGLRRQTDERTKE